MTNQKTKIVLVNMYEENPQLRIMTADEAVDFFRLEDYTELEHHEAMKLSDSIEYVDINLNLYPTSDRLIKLKQMLTSFEFEETIHHVDCRADIYVFA